MYKRKKTEEETVINSKKLAQKIININKNHNFIPGKKEYKNINR